jgi:hypothetical protein
MDFEILGDIEQIETIAKGPGSGIEPDCGRLMAVAGGASSKGCPCLAGQQDGSPIGTRPMESGELSSR